LKKAKSTIPTDDSSVPEPRYTYKTALTALALLVFGFVFLRHFYLVWTYSVDVPYRDEWDTLSADGLSANFSPDWLFRWHNEHRLVTTKLLVWVLYKFDGWNLATHQILNYLIFGLLLFTLGVWARKRGAGLETWVIVAFLTFLLSPLINENHQMGYQSQIHFALLFFVGAIYFLFDERQSWPSIWLGSFMALLSIYSLSSGMATSAVLLLLFAAYKASRLRGCTEPDQRGREQLQAVAGCVVIAVAMGLWSIGYHKAPDAGASALPYTAAFWEYFLNIVALGFGIQDLSVGDGLLCLLVVLAPLVGDFVRRRGNLPAASWGVYAGILGILSVLAIIAVGRAIGFGIPQSKSSRYGEIGMLLVPMAAMAWSLFLHDRPKWKAGALTVLWVLCFKTYYPTWSLFEVYQKQFTERTAGLECVTLYYNGKGKGKCKALYPGPIPDRLDIARKLDLSFYRSIKSGQTERLEPR